MLTPELQKRGIGRKEEEGDQKRRRGKREKVLVLMMMMMMMMKTAIRRRRGRGRAGRKRRSIPIFPISPIFILKVKEPSTVSVILTSEGEEEWDKVVGKTMSTGSQIN